MQILQRSTLALISAGLSLSIATPALSTERQGSGASATPASSRVAYLPNRPAAARTFAITPERRALLNTIRYAEGTWARGHDMGYRIMFGGSLMRNLDRHPNKVNYSARYASAAAGAYQFMPFTWTMVQKAMGLRGFHPEVQDQAAIFLIRRRKALHLADRGVLTPQLAALLAPEWASFPTLAGHSYYGQPVKRYAELGRLIRNAVGAFIGEVRSGSFPDDDHSFHARRRKGQVREASLSAEPVSKAGGYGPSDDDTDQSASA